MTITPFFKDMSKCAKHSNDGQCCCNCASHIAILGHPWVTGTKISQPTGAYVCTALSTKDKDNFIASHKHGACECWTPQNSSKKTATKPEVRS